VKFRTNMQSISGSSPGLMGSSRYLVIRGRICSGLDTPMAGPRESDTTDRPVTPTYPRTPDLPSRRWSS
jgi:hypothetical protein